MINSKVLPHPKIEIPDSAVDKFHGFRTMSANLSEVKIQYFKFIVTRQSQLTSKVQKKKKQPKQTKQKLFKCKTAGVAQSLTREVRDAGKSGMMRRQRGERGSGDEGQDGMAALAFGRGVLAQE